MSIFQPINHSRQVEQGDPNQPQQVRLANGGRAEVLIHHEQASRGDVLHIFLDGEYHKAIELCEGRSDTSLAVPHDEWRTDALVHSIDTYKASANGYVQEHQSIVVSAYRAWGLEPSFGVASSGCPESSVTPPEPMGVTESVEFRVSKNGLGFSTWSLDYQDPAVDGTQDGRYVVQMRFLDIEGAVLDVQTVAFDIHHGVRYTV